MQHWRSTCQTPAAAMSDNLVRLDSSISPLLPSAFSAVECCAGFPRGRVMSASASASASAQTRPTQSVPEPWNGFDCRALASWHLSCPVHAAVNGISRDSRRRGTEPCPPLLTSSQPLMRGSNKWASSDAVMSWHLVGCTLPPATVAG